MRPTITTKVDRWSSARELTHWARKVLRRDTHKVARAEGKRLTNGALWEMLEDRQTLSLLASRAENLRGEIDNLNADLESANAYYLAEDNASRFAHGQVVVASDGGSQLILDLWLSRAAMADDNAHHWARRSRIIREEIEELKDELFITEQEMGV